MNEIKLITDEEAGKLIESYDFKGRYEPMGLFYVIAKDRSGNTLYVGYDNSDGHCWVELFYSIGACMAWLRGEDYD